MAEETLMRPVLWGFAGDAVFVSDERLDEIAERCRGSDSSKIAELTPTT